LGAYCSSAAAAGELRQRWALPVAQADVRVSRRHDRIDGKVTLDGRVILDCVTKPLLIQVDPHYTSHRAERGRPRVEAFDQDAWNAGPVRLADPVLAT